MQATKEKKNSSSNIFLFGFRWNSLSYYSQQFQIILFFISLTLVVFFNTIHAGNDSMTVEKRTQPGNQNRNKFPKLISPFFFCEAWLYILHNLSNYMFTAKLCIQDTANECTRYDTKQTDGEAPVMLELWRMQSTPLLLLLPGPPT